MLRCSGEVTAAIPTCHHCLPGGQALRSQPDMLSLGVPQSPPVREIHYPQLRDRKLRLRKAASPRPSHPDRHPGADLGCLISNPKHQLLFKISKADGLLSLSQHWQLEKLQGSSDFYFLRVFGWNRMFPESEACLNVSIPLQCPHWGSKRCWMRLL